MAGFLGGDTLMMQGRDDIWLPEAPGRGENVYCYVDWIVEMLAANGYNGKHPAPLLVPADPDGDRRPLEISYTHRSKTVKHNPDNFYYDPGDDVGQGFLESTTTSTTVGRIALFPEKHGTWENVMRIQTASGGRWGDSYRVDVWDGPRGEYFSDE